MPYSPAISIQNSKTLRRIAWALDIPMTEALAEIINTTTGMLNSEKVCPKCQDKSYCKEGCVFYKPIKPAPMTLKKGEGNIRIILKENEEDE